MEEILENLKKSYSENRNSQKLQKQFKFYSNLSVTQPLQKQSELATRVQHGIEYLSNRILQGHIGLQSVQLAKLFNSTKNICEFVVPDEQQNLEFPLEIYTTLLAIDLLGNYEDDDEPYSHLNRAVIKSLLHFILPDSGISTFGIFKEKINSESEFKSRPQSATSSSGCSSGEFDLEISLHDLTAKEECDQIVCSNEEETNLAQENCLLPDDCNTTALALSVLLREGILDIKPTASVTELLLSNVGDFIEKDPHAGVIRAFFNSSAVDKLDAVSCASVLYLYYTLTEELEDGDMSVVSLNYDEHVESTELFLVETLNNLLTVGDHQDQDKPDQESNYLYSHSFELHHSSDTLLYFLSRCTSISKRARDIFAEPLINLLEMRISRSSQTDGPLNVAMRILSADELGLLSSAGNWIRRNLEAECCKLTEMQDKSDGSWPIDSLFKVDVDETQFHFGGREVSTIFACKALHVYNQSEKDAKFYIKCCKDYLY